MYVARVDGGHHERCDPHPIAQCFVHHGLVARRLAWPLEAGRERERVLQQVQHARLGGRCGHGGLEARGRAAREGALHLAHPAAHARGRVAEAVAELLLQQEHAQVERNGVKPAREHDARAAGLGGGFVRVDHLAHPGRLAAQVHIVHAGLGAGGHQFVAIQLVGAHGGQHQARGVHQRLQAGGVAGVGHDQRGVGRGAHFVAHGGEFVGIAAPHGPAQAAAGGVALQQVLDHQAAGEAGGAVDDEVKRFGHGGGSVRQKCKVRGQAEAALPGEAAILCGRACCLCRAGAWRGARRA